MWAQPHVPFQHQQQQQPQHQQHMMGYPQQALLFNINQAPAAAFPQHHQHSPMHYQPQRWQQPPYAPSGAAMFIQNGYYQGGGAAAPFVPFGAQQPVGVMPGLMGGHFNPYQQHQQQHQQPQHGQWFGPQQLQSPQLQQQQQPAQQGPSAFHGHSPNFSAGRGQ